MPTPSTSKKKNNQHRLDDVKNIVKELDNIYAKTTLKDNRIESGTFEQLVDKQTQEINQHMAHLETQQDEAQSQINKLTSAKIKLEKLLSNNSQLTETEQRKNQQLQKQLSHLIAEKEAEFVELNAQVETVTLKAEQEKMRLLSERDTARQLYEQRQILQAREEEQYNQPISKTLYFFIGLGLVLLLSSATFFILPHFGYDIQWADLFPEKQQIATQSVVETPIEVIAPEPVVKKRVRLKPIRSFNDKLKGGGLSPLMVQLPAGSFKMGSPPYMPRPDEIPQIEVHLQSFSISRYEITFDQYLIFAKQNHMKIPDDRSWGKGKQPVINVSWDDANAYTRWLSRKSGHQYRLPSEREWEYAAGAGREGDFAWGADIGNNNGVCGVCGSQWDAKKPAPVGRFKPNPFGLYDMSGNVAEWTHVCRHRNYRNAPSMGQMWTGGECDKRMVRGGSFRSYANELRINKRNAYSPNAYSDELGFRVVRFE